MKKGKVYLKLNGGLGNQMFQWAVGRMISETTDMEVYLDMSYFKKGFARPYQLDIFKLEPKTIADAWTKFKLDYIWTFRSLMKWQSFMGVTYYSEAHFHFDKNITKIRPETYIDGFFQSELYFKTVEKFVKEDFVFEVPPDENNRKVINKIRGENAVSLHIRRGDYVQKKRYSDAYAHCSIDYYKKAVDYIAERFPDPVIYIFSDDIPWAKANLKLPYKCFYVSHNTGKKSYEDMRLMSICNHNIIANSSFSWWGAWLNENPDKIVIAPTKWFQDDSIIQTDIIPKNWVQLDNEPAKEVV